MAKDINDINNYKLGYYKGLQAAKEGKSEAEVVALETNQDIIEGIHDGFTMHLHIVFADSVKNLREAISSNSKIEDSVSKMQIARSNYMQRIYDSDFTLRKERPDMYSVDKDGKHCYTLFKGKGGKWSCSCAGYSFRHKCKHVDAINELLNNSTQRLPQHLARVRALEKSLKIWQERLEANPNDKTAKKNVEVRTKALEEAKKKADEIEAMPKPQRRNREEFEGVLPQLDKLFEGLGDYTIVGSWRRGKDTYKDCDILTVMSPANWSKLKERLQNDENFGPAPGHTHADFGDEVVRGGYKNGDVVEYLDINRVPNPDEWGAWLLFRTGCFSGETKVLTPYGFVRIDEIVPGDVVFSGKGIPTEVNAVSVKTFNDVVTFKSRGASVTSTLDHRVLVAGNGTQGVQYSEPRWQEAGTLGRYCSLVYPKIKLQTIEDVDLGLAFMVGFYMADGNLHARLGCQGNKKKHQSYDYRVEIADGVCSFDSRFSIPYDKREEFERILGSRNIPIYAISGGRGNEGTIVIKNKEINQFLLDYAGVTVKKLGLHKKFDSRILSWSHSAKMELLKGFFLGDGTLSKAEHATPVFLNTNKDILYGLWLIAKSEYSVNGITVRKDKGLPMYSFSVTGKEANRMYGELLVDVCKAKGIIPISWSDDPAYTTEFENNVCYQKILRGKPNIQHYNDKVYVYDIEVEDDSHTFLIEDGFVVHNSAQFNIAMRGWLKKFGCGLNERGLIGPNGEIVASKTEEDIFNAIGIPYIEPKDRETPQKFYQEVKKLDKPKFLQED